MEGVNFQWWEVFLGGICTLAIYSFLWRENQVYRIFEHFFIGIATSWGIITGLRTLLWPRVLKPLLGLDIPRFPDGSWATEYHPANLLFLLPMGFGLLYYSIYSRRFSWLVQLVIGFSFGAAGGLAFSGTFNEMLPQVFDTFRPLFVSGEWGTSLNNTFFVFTVFCVMSYFFFTFKNNRGGSSAAMTLSYVSSCGRWLMMGCFGAFFGSTVMARMALLVERLDFLINKWWPIIRATYGN